MTTLIKPASKPSAPAFHQRNLRRQLSHLERHWLFEVRSLSERLAACGTFQVKRVGSAQTHQGVGYFRRQVLLQVNQQPWVYAETSIPRAQLQRFQQLYLNRLGDRSIGTFLIAKYHLPKTNFCVKPLDLRDPRMQRLCATLNCSADRLWSRQSLYLWATTPIEICEIFLPTSPIETAYFT